MVLWEITLGTAYFLGLKRTYRLGLRIQRKLISSKRQRVRQFVQRRTRSVFNVALRVHRNIQERDIEMGRNLGNRLLRWLDRMKPSAQIRGSPTPGSTGKSNPSLGMTKQIKSSVPQKPSGSFGARKNGESDRNEFSSRFMWSKPFPRIRMMMRPANPVGGQTQHRHLSTGGLDFPMQQYVGSKWDGGVIRKDIMLWMLQK